jgi:hypothetical protein
LFAERNSNFANQFIALNNQLDPSLIVNLSGRGDNDELGWKKEDGERWGLFFNGRILAQDTTVPDKDTMQAIIRNNNIVSSVDFLRAYLAEKGSVPGVALLLAQRKIFQNLRAGLVEGSIPGPDAPSYSAWDETWREAARHLRSVLDSPDVLYNLPSVSTGFPAASHSQTMKSLSKPYLTIVESLLEVKPSLQRLWDQWFFWRAIEGAKRPVEPLLDCIKYSPFAQMWDTLPHIVINTYYQECKDNGDWPKLISLLKTAWDREISRKNDNASASGEKDKFAQFIQRETFGSMGDALVIPLMEAYLNYGRPFEADEVFNAYLSAGGKFADISKIVALALEKGQERLAREWEGKVKK